MRVDLIIKWYDCWIGFFYDKRKQWLYFLPIPFVGIVFKFKTDPEQPVYKFVLNEPENAKDPGLRRTVLLQNGPFDGQQVEASNTEFIAIKVFGGNENSYWYKRLTDKVYQYHPIANNLKTT